MRMMFIAIVSCFALMSYTPSELETIRYNYSRAATDKDLCMEMIEKLKNSNEPIQLAYLGAFRTIWAKHTSNPFEKLKTFNKGKANIEASIEQSPSNTEIRFIRLSIQLNAPKILGYSDNIDEDKKFILENRSDIKSGTLLKMIDECIKSKE